MTAFPAALVAASTSRTIGLVLFGLASIALVVYVFVNWRQARDEAGAEIELAPNRKPYLRDEELEGPKLDRTLGWGLVTLAVIGVGLPLYWLNEPGRQSGAIDEFETIFARRGATLYEEGAQCVNCHGPEGSGGVAPYAVTDEEGEFVAQVNWRAPALNTVLLRFTREEVEYIINYGRPFSPMAAWGTASGLGPLNEQQVSNLVAYLESIQLTPEESQAAVEAELRDVLDLGEAAEIDYDDPKVGEALFNLGRDNSFAGGAYACGRCHTRGWSIQEDPEAEPVDPEKFAELVRHPDGAGALGPSLRNGLIPRQFLTLADLVDFVTAGSEDGKLYGINGQGSGKMPGFGDNPNTEDVEADGMLSADMICAIARYEASLAGADEAAAVADMECTHPEQPAADEEEEEES